VFAIRAEHQKAFWAVIQRVRFVVDDFPLGQIPAKHRFYDKAMFQNVSLLGRVWVIWSVKVAVAFHNLLAPFPAWVTLA
jgi:hypothetical protein